MYDLILIPLKEAQESGHFSEVFLVVFGFWWGPVGSRVGDPPPGVEGGVKWCRKIGFCASLGVV